MLRSAANLPHHRGRRHGRHRRRRGGRSGGPGDDLLATGRDPGRLAALAATGVATLPLDLGDEGAGEALGAAAAARGWDSLDGLVLVAGGLGPIGPTRSVDLGALAATFGEHVVGPLRIVQALAPLLDAAAGPLGGALLGRRRDGGVPPLQRLRPGQGGRGAARREPRRRGARAGGSTAVAPGFVATGIHDATLAAGRASVGPYYEETERRLGQATPPEVAAGLVAFLLSDAAAGVSGRLISAPWDPWEDETGREVLRGASDFGRLRRIDEQRYHDQG